MYFPLFLMQSGRKRSAHSRRQFIQCFLMGAAFRQRPLSRLLIDVLAGTRTLPPEEPEPKDSGRPMAMGALLHLSIFPKLYKRVLLLFAGKGYPKGV